MEQDILAPFNIEFTRGSVKKAMEGISSADLWKMPIDKIKVHPDFNVRVHDERHKAHVRAIANSIKTEGFYQHEPLACYVAVVDGEQIVYVTNGHTRLEATKIANAEGAKIESLPIVTAAPGTTMEDLIVGLVQTNIGQPLTMLEVAAVCKRLIGYGWDEQKIADHLSYSKQSVIDHLVLAGAPRSIIQLVISAKVKPTLAIKAIRKYGDKAFETLESGLQANGGARVTAKHMPGAVYQRWVRKSTPVVLDTIAEVRSDPAYASIAPSLREKLDALINDMAKAKAGEVIKKASKRAPSVANAHGAQAAGGANQPAMAGAN